MADKSSDEITLTRRQAIAALGAGVVVAGGAVALTGVEATRRAQSDAEQQLRQVQAQLNDSQNKYDVAQSESQKKYDQVLSESQTKQDELSKQLAAAHAQLELYKGLTGLYDTLDKIGIDSIVGAALSAYKGSLDALAGGVNLLREGIVRAENALDSFETGFASIRSALTTAEAAWANVNALLKNAQELIAKATSPLIPLLDQATKFFDDLLGKIPFGAGESARQTLNGITGLIVAVPSALDALENGLFRTLRESWFSDDNARNLETTLAKPVLQGVLQPARKFLDQVEVTLTAWEAQVAKPVNSALSQRQIVMRQIAEYKDKNGLT